MDVTRLAAASQYPFSSGKKRVRPGCSRAEDGSLKISCPERTVDTPGLDRFGKCAAAPLISAASANGEPFPTLKRKESRAFSGTHSLSEQAAQVTSATTGTTVPAGSFRSSVMRVRSTCRPAWT